MEKGKYGILIGNSSDKLKLEAVLVVSDDTVLEQMDKICPLQEELEQIYLTKELKEKICAETGKTDNSAGSGILF